MKVILGVLGFLLIGALLLHMPDRAVPANDEVLDLLPADLIGYAGIEDFRLAYGEAEKFIERLAPGTTLFQDLERHVQDGIDELPAKLRRSTRKGLRELVSAHLAIVPTSNGDPGYVFIVRLDDADLLKKLVYEDLDVFAEEELSIGSRKVQRIPTKHDLPGENVYVVADAGFGIAASDLSVLRDLLKRLDGKEAGPALRDTPLYRRLSTKGRSRVGLRLYCKIGPLLQTAMSSSYYGERYGRFLFDEEDAIMGYSGIRGLWVDATLKDARIRSRVRIDVDRDCYVYHSAWRQPEGPKELLRYIPPESAFAAHVNIKDGEDARRKLDALLRRADAVYNRIRTQPRSYRIEFYKEVRRSLGIPIERIAGTIGSEVAAFYAPRDWDRTMEDGNGLCFIGKMKDAETLRKTLKDLLAGPAFDHFEWVEKKHRTWILHVAKKNRDFPAAYAIDGDVLICGADEDTVRRALDVKEGKNLAGRVSGKGSKVLYVNFKNSWRFLHLLTEGDLPDWHEKMSDGVADCAVLREDDGGVSFEAEDSLVIAAWIGSIPVAMIADAFDRHRPDPFEGRINLKRPEPEVELPKDPKEARRKIDALIRDLSADDGLRRELATRELKKIGEPAIGPLVQAFKENRDPELRARAQEILLHLKAYDALPALIDQRLQDIVEAIGRGLRDWEGPGWNVEGPGPVFMEPNPHEIDYILEPLARLDLDVLASAEGVRRFAAMLADETIPLSTRVGIALVLTRLDAAPAAAELRRALDSPNVHIRSFALIALGDAKDRASREAVLKALGSGDLAKQRCAFLAAERSKDRELVPKLLELLGSEDLETRFNAAFTLEKISGGAVRVNVFADDRTVAAQVAAARRWWRDR